MPGASFIVAVKKFLAVSDPIDGATVKLSYSPGPAMPRVEITALSDISGNATLNNVDVNGSDYRLTVEKQTWTKADVVPVFSFVGANQFMDPKVVLLDFRGNVAVEQVIEVRGMIAAGLASLQGVSVRVYNVGLGVDTTVVTDIEGKARFNLIAGVYWVFVSKSGFQSFGVSAVSAVGLSNPLSPNEMWPMNFIMTAN